MADGRTRTLGYRVIIRLAQCLLHRCVSGSYGSDPLLFAGLPDLGGRDRPVGVVFKDEVFSVHHNQRILRHDHFIYSHGTAPKAYEIESTEIRKL